MAGYSGYVSLGIGVSFRIVGTILHVTLEELDATPETRSSEKTELLSSLCQREKCEKALKNAQTACQSLMDAGFPQTHCPTDYRLKDLFITNYATRAFLVGGIGELWPIEVDLFPPKYRLDIVLHTVPGVLFLEYSSNDVLGSDHEPISAKRKNPPQTPPVAFEKSVLCCVCIARTEKTGQAGEFSYVEQIGPKIPKSGGKPCVEVVNLTVQPFTHGRMSGMILKVQRPLESFSQSRCQQSKLWLRSFLRSSLSVHIDPAVVDRLPLYRKMTPTITITADSETVRQAGVIRRAPRRWFCNHDSPRRGPRRQLHTERTGREDVRDRALAHSLTLYVILLYYLRCEIGSVLLCNPSTLVSRIKGREDVRDRAPAHSLTLYVILLYYLRCEIGSILFCNPSTIVSRIKGREDVRDRAPAHSLTLYVILLYYLRCEIEDVRDRAPAHSLTLYVILLYYLRCEIGSILFCNPSTIVSRIKGREDVRDRALAHSLTLYVILLYYLRCEIGSILFCNPSTIVSRIKGREDVRDRALAHSLTLYVILLYYLRCEILLAKQREITDVSNKTNERNSVIPLTLQQFYYVFLTKSIAFS
ncbi:hypothetical protein J6590_056670 [Homalodisca vitripennis]|nr:hypothetical protein J6590_056670 [Homalodisca vitripennis]